MEVDSLLLLLILGLTIALGVPVSISLVVSASIVIVAFTDFSLGIIPLKLYMSTNSFPLLAIPFFVFAGGIMSTGGMAQRLIDLAESMVGRFHGGVAMVSVLSCMMFAAVSGSTAATTAAIGMIAIPAMMRSGFSRGTATSLMATSGSIGIIIPPSIPLVLLGVISGISIGDLFLGGVVPGILLGAGLMSLAHVQSRIAGQRSNTAGFDFKGFVVALWRAIPSLLTIVFVLGGIVYGIVTPTEAAVIAVLWAFMVTYLFPKMLPDHWEHCGSFAARSVFRLFGEKSSVTINCFGPILVNAVKISGIVVLCIGATAPFSWLLSVEQVPQALAMTMESFGNNPTMIIMMMIAVFLLVGTVIDLTPSMILLVPIFMPVAMDIGMSPVQFGLVLTIALGIGQSTPPVGISLFVACSVSKADLGEVAKPIVPFLLVMTLVLVLVALWPPLTNALPALF